jgi:hypothetical protein
MIKRILGVLAIWVITFMVFKACRHEPLLPDNDEPIAGSCHPDTIYFNRDLLPLLSASCARSGCHDAATQADGVKLTDYSSVLETGDVKPGNPEDSDLYEVLVDDDPEDRMPPPPSDPLTSEQIAMFYTWIMQGALNLECVEEDCELENVTFSGTVLGNLQQYGCVSCHSGSSPSGGVVLSSYSTVKDMAESGRLMGAILHLSGYSSMPPSGNAMDQCSADQIQKWIDDEMPNN